MCGIAGFLDPRASIPDRRTALDQMGDVMALRGPDAQGVHLDDEPGIGLVHRRLSIIDLSPTGAQPMASASGRYTLVFNGEIYNFPELRDELEGPGVAWRGHSDTEVFLAAVEAWGLDEALVRANGMFALALWDRADRKLHLVRDRLGIKPLFYGWPGGVFTFASDPNAFDALPGFSGEIDRGALALFLRHGYVPAPHSIFAGVKKLEPGCLITVEEGAGQTEPRRWWSLNDSVTQGRTRPFTGTATEAVDELEKLMTASVSRRMIADVPLGAFLSGGVDSSAVVALMQQAGSRPAKTFSIGFAEEDFNEADHAARVAKHLGTDHTDLVMTPDESRDVIPLLPGMFAEPFADPSQIPTYLVSRLARRDVTVSLSGDGGDELFAGYHRYAWGAALERRADPFPAWALGTGATLIRGLPVGLWDAFLKRGAAFDSDGRAFAMTGDRLHKLAGVLKGRDAADRYRRLVSIWEDPAAVVGASESPSALAGLRGDPPGLDTVRSMQYWDQRTYLPDDILAKVDRASMAVSLEARVPLLDHTVVDFAWSLPPDYHVREGRTKWVLRRVLDRHVPRELIDRPKQGFSVPLADWLRGPLKEWAGGHLDPAVLKTGGLLAPGPVTRCWNEFQSGRRQWQNRLWNVLMFQTWLAHRREKEVVVKVLHVITGLEVGGAESMLAKLLARMDRDRFDPTVVSLMKGGPNRQVIADLGIPVHEAGMAPGLPSPAVLWKLARWAGELRPDLIQGWMYHGNLAAAWLKARTPGSPRMFWNIRHSVDDIRREKPMTRAVIRLGARLDGGAEAVLVNSRASLEQHAALGYDRDRLVLVPNGFDLNRFRPDPLARRRVRDDLEIPDDVPLVGMVARRHPMKGQPDFLKMAALFRDKLGITRFLMVGRGVTGDDPELAALVRTGGLKGAVHMVGPRSDTPAVMAALDVLVVPSLFGEGFPNVLGEAMACGVPCVATAVGDSGEVIADCGRLVPPGRPEALAGGVLELLDQPEDDRSELSARCRRRVAEHYALDAIAGRYEDLYASS